MDGGGRMPTWRKSLRIAAVVAVSLLPIRPLARANALPEMPPGEFVRKTVQNELKASENPASRHMFVSVKAGRHGSQTKLYCETKDAMAGLLLANDGKPLTAAERQQEEARLEQLSKDPDSLRKKRQREQEDQERITRIVRAMPD